MASCLRFQREISAQHFTNGGRKGTRAVAAELAVDYFEAADEVDDIAPCVWAAGGSAEMCAASEWTVFVDKTAQGLRIEEGTGAIIAGGQGFAPGGFEGACGEEGFAAGEIGRFAGGFEVTALCAKLTGAVDRLLGKITVDGSDFVECRIW